MSLASALRTFQHGGHMAKDSILGDINPTPSARRGERARDERADDRVENLESMEGGSRHDQSRHPGSREVTEGVTGGLGTETGGSRNFRQGTGASGGDIGNRPE
jgi:hypothetical protein